VPVTTPTPATTPASASDRVVILGKIVGTFGIKGWVKVKSFTDPVDNILDYPVWLLESAGQWTELALEDGRVTDKGVIAKFEGWESPEEARLRVGCELGVWRSQMPPPAEGEYYWADLEGIEAIGAQGERLGTVDHFRSTPGGTVMIVKGEREHWIPFAKERIVKVELAAGRIVLDWSVDW